MQLKRWGTGIVLALVVLGVIFMLPAMFFCVLVGVAALIAQSEAHALLFTETETRRPYTFCGLFACATVLGVSFTGSVHWLAGTFVSLVVFCFIFHLFVFRDIHAVPSAVGKQLLGLFYVPLLASFFVLIRLEPNGAWWVVLALLVVFSGDTGAYYAGKTFGKRKLYPEVSPKKTWAGSVGGALCSVCFGLLFRKWFLPEWSLIECVVLCGVTAVLAQIGDLFESLLKRAVEVKDSGRILPGHGGILDRIDGALFAGPPVFLYLKLMYTGQP